MDTLTLTRPDDWHLHVRDGAHLAAALPHSARQFARAIIMPNLKPPVTTTEAARAYRERIIAALPEGSDFQPLMTLYLTDQTSAEEIRRAADSGFIHGVKLYPAGATTNSASGVTDVRHCDAALATMAEVGLPLQVHGEVTDPQVDIFDREAVFIDQVLAPLLERHPHLKVILEHITTREAVDFVRKGPARLAATITPQHLLFDRNRLLVGGIRPHFYCLPILKREQHRQALLDAATSSDPKFFLGTDSAPHTQSAKETACGCAGCFSAPAALELYAWAFDQRGALDRLEGFASHYGADFYGLPRNEGTVTLTREAWTLPDQYPYGDEAVVPLMAGEALPWRLRAGGV